jgi:SAM-dependent methyltransferase
LATAAGAAECRTCLHTFAEQNGVWRMLRPERVAPIENFLADYTKIRLAEGRGSADAAFYRNLPECPADHPLAWQWGIRRRTFSCFQDRVLPSLGAHLRILDLGAGTGWLSNRLAQLGHEPCAVDLSRNGQDGLEAARHFDSRWPCIQAEFDYLPFPNASVDTVVFNASLHYSTDYVRTLREALRVLAPGGSVVVLETPVYRSESSGRRMIAERHESFLKRYGTRSNSMPSLEYLTWPRVAGLGRKLSLTWRIVRPWYGFRWALRPWIARAKLKREPSQFPVLIATTRTALR